MEKIRNEKELNRYLELCGIPELFTDPDLPFELYAFRRHEIVNNFFDSSEYLLFFVAGRLMIRQIRDDGTAAGIGEIREFTVLGDMEYADRKISMHIVEAMTPSRFIILHLTEEIRAKLDRDPVFLRYLLSSVTKKFILFSDAATSSKTLRERLLFHLEQTQKDHRIRSVAETAELLQCSRRQLLRILKQLTEEGIAEKTGKGEYRLCIHRGME